MSHPKYENRGNSLGKFIEECGECLAAAGKSIRFGLDSFNPEPGSNHETNRSWLSREIIDLEKAILRLKKIL